MRMEIPARPVPLQPTRKRRQMPFTSDLDVHREAAEERPEVPGGNSIFYFLILLKENERLWVTK